MARSCTWLFGRGASIANGLCWSVPKEWYYAIENSTLDRGEIVDRIIKAIREEMANPIVDCTPYKEFISLLSLNANENHCHNLLTTNWDFLLQRELDNWIKGNQPGFTPKFLGTHSSIFHLNGTVESNYTKNRSPFLLEVDDAEYRKETVEANIAFHKILWSNILVFVGMSFECSIDRGLLSVLNYHEDNLPFGEAIIFIVEPNEVILNQNVANMGEC